MRSSTSPRPASSTPPWAVATTFSITISARGFYALANGEEGIYVASHDKTLMTTTLNVMAHSGDGLSVSMVKYPFVKTGETWTSEPTIIRLFRGDWHVAARAYRAWADTWIPKPDPPKWLRRMNGWIIPNLKAQNGSRYTG